MMHCKKLPCSPLDERTSLFFLAQRFPTGLVDLLCGGYVLSRAFTDSLNPPICCQHPLKVNSLCEGGVQSRPTSPELMVAPPGDGSSSNHIPSIPRVRARYTDVKGLSPCDCIRPATIRFRFHDVWAEHH